MNLVNGHHGKNADKCVSIFGPSPSIGSLSENRITRNRNELKRFNLVYGPYSKLWTCINI